MKIKVIGMFLLATFGFGSASSYADYNVPVSTSGCNWVTTSSGVSGGSGVGTVYWYNDALSCANGSTLATKSWWTSTSGQQGCSIAAVSPYKLTGNCSSYSIFYTVVEVDTRPEGAACTWNSTSHGSSGWGSTTVYFYAPIGPCKDTLKVMEYNNGVYYRTTYSR